MLAVTKVLLFIFILEHVRCRLTTLPPRFLREPANPYNLRIEPPILVSAKLLLDSKSSPESSEITTNDDSPPTKEEENYSISQDWWWQDYGPMEPIDSNAAEENFDDDSVGPVITLPERRHKREESETEVSEKVEEQKTETTLAPEIETTTTRHSFAKNTREKKSTKRGEKMKSVPKYPSHSRTARPIPKAENILYLFENASINKTNQ